MISSAGTIGTTRILLNTAKTNPAVDNPAIGRGLILHPSFPLMGLFDRTINLLEGLDSATYCAAFGVTPGFIYETMGGLPAYGAVLVPGSGKQVFDELVQYNNYAGFGCMLVDTPSSDNRVMLDENDGTVLQYTLTEADKVVVKHRVVLVGHTNYPAMMPSDASAFYARNIANLLDIMLERSADGVVLKDLDADEITRASQLRPST